MKTILTGIAIILFGIAWILVFDGGLALVGLGFSFLGVFIALMGYSKDEYK